VLLKYGIRDRVNRTGTDNAGNNYPGHSTVNDVLGDPVVFSEEETILYATLSKKHISKAREKLKFWTIGLF